ncbi:MAG: roadblock/LC7 domain-containing protein [Armatimonadota bacterium]
MNGDDFILYEEDMEAIQQELARLLAEAQATCVLLVHGSGQLVAQSGFTRDLDTTSLAALTAGAFASTKEIARLIDEPEFSVLFHEGSHTSMHLSLVGTHASLVTIFDKRTSLGLVRLCAAQTAERLNHVFARAAERELKGQHKVVGLPAGELFGQRPSEA